MQASSTQDWRVFPGSRESPFLQPAGNLFLPVALRERIEKDDVGRGNLTQQPNQCLLLPRREATGVLEGKQLCLENPLAQSPRRASRRCGRVVQLVGKPGGELAQSRHFLLLDALTPAHLLLEGGLHYLQVVRFAPFFRDLAVGYAVDRNARIARLLTGWVDSQERAMVNAGSREPADHLVTFGDLGLNSEAGIDEHREHVGER